MLLYDKLIYMSRDTRAKKDEFDKHKAKLLEESEVILASNVAQYFYVTSSKDEWDVLQDFPNVAPPFKTFFIEWDMPSSINNNGEKEKVEGVMHGAKVGVLFTATEDFDNKAYKDLGVRWIVVGIPFIWSRVIDKIHSAGAAQLAIMPDGSVVKDRSGYLVGLTNDQLRIKDSAEGAITGSMHVALLALSLMHCKNVSIKAESPSRALSHQYQRKHGVPLVSYKVLEIEPMKRVLNSEGGANTNGLKKALHICRGHFKDYTEKGLFGRYKGMYWWDSHVRGDSTSGIVVKDYSIKK